MESAVDAINVLSVFCNRYTVISAFIKATFTTYTIPKSLASYAVIKLLAKKNHIDSTRAVPLSMNKLTTEY